MKSVYVCERGEVCHTGSVVDLENFLTRVYMSGSLTTSVNLLYSGLNSFNV